MRLVWESTPIHGIPEVVPGWSVGFSTFQVAPLSREIKTPGGRRTPVLCGA
jgi:hypothetical protein